MIIIFMTYVDSENIALFSTFETRQIGLSNLFKRYNSTNNNY